MPANIKSIELRNLQIEDYKQLKNSMIESIQKWKIILMKRARKNATSTLPTTFLSR
jgi:hypothetical protein